jgi:hypothetical protein
MATGPRIFEALRAKGDFHHAKTQRRQEDRSRSRSRSKSKSMSTSKSKRKNGTTNGGLVGVRRCGSVVL